MSRVLVVEDDPETLGVVADSLREGGHDVIEATDGQEAFFEAQRTGPDVIVLDLKMDIMDGRAFAEAARRVPGWERVPIVLMSGSPDLEAAAEALRDIGVCASVRKPFDIDHLLRIVDQLAAQPVAD